MLCSSLFGGILEPMDLVGPNKVPRLQRQVPHSECKKEIDMKLT